MSLPIFKNDDRDFQLMQTSWSSTINPVLSNPLSQGIFLKSVALISGVNVINHRLGRTQQGWVLTDANASASVYRSQPFNNLTLTLTSDAVVTVNLYVF